MTPQQLLDSAKCYTCMGVSLDEGMELALLATVDMSETVAPVLSFTFPELFWTYNGLNPHQWFIQESVDLGVTWDDVSISPGGDRSAPFLDSGVLARVIGKNVDGTQATPPSNSVGIP